MEPRPIDRRHTFASICDIWQRDWNLPSEPKKPEFKPLGKTSETTEAENELSRPETSGGQVQSAVDPQQLQATENPTNRTSSGEPSPGPAVNPDTALRNAEHVLQPPPPNEQQATPPQASNTQPSSSQASRTRASSTQATDTPATGTQASNTQASNTQASNTQASNTQASITQASGTQATGTQTTGTQASNTHATGTQTTGTHASNTHATGAEADGAEADGAEANGAEANGAEANHRNIREQLRHGARRIRDNLSKCFRFTRRL